MKIRTQLQAQKVFFYPWSRTSVIFPTPMLSSSHLPATGDHTTNNFYRLLFLDGSLGGTSSEGNISLRKGVDRCLAPPLLGQYLQTRKRKSKRSKHSYKRRKRSSTSSSSPLSDNQSHDYGRYKRSRRSPQAVEPPVVLRK